MKRYIYNLHGKYFQDAMEEIGSRISCKFKAMCAYILLLSAQHDAIFDRSILRKNFQMLDDSSTTANSITLEKINFWIENCGYE